MTQIYLEDAGFDLDEIKLISEAWDETVARIHAGQYEAASGTLNGDLIVTSYYPKPNRLKVWLPEWGIQATGKLNGTIRISAREGF